MHREENSSRNRLMKKVVNDMHSLINDIYFFELFVT